MINQKEIATRLKKLLDYYDLTASAFAEELDVQASSISHLLSGRNKPSLDFVLKVLSTYSEVDLDWLIQGKGNFPKSSTSPVDFATFKKGTKSISRIVVLYTDGTFSAYEAE